MTYICAPIFVDLPLDNGVTVEFSPSLAPVVPIPGGPKGLDGIDGVSPTITVTDILGGHKVTITDKDGTETFDVMDGGISEEDFLKVFPQDIASGAVASFPDGADGVPVVDLTVDITPKQSGSGDPSPTNVRPISGWSEATLTRTGENLYDPSTTEILNAYIGATTNAIMAGNVEKTMIVYLPAGTYSVTKETNGGNNPRLAVCSFSDHPVIGSVGTPIIRVNGKSAVFTVSSDTWVAIWYYNGVSADGDWEYCRPHTSLSLHYSVTIDLDGVRYGGKLDVLTGVLTVDYTGGVLNGSEGWQRGSGDTWFYRGVSGTYRTGVTPAYTSHFKSVYNQVNAAWMIYGQIHVYPDTTIAPSGNTAEGLAEFKAWLAQNNVDFYTKLVTPLVIQLTPQEVETLLGTNNIWADTGNTTVKYRADIGLYVQKLTGSTEEDMVANVSIASGKYFMVGNTLYLSTTSIPAGDIIKPGTNCTLTNLAAALNALNS